MNKLGGKTCARPVVCVETGQIFNSGVMASRWLGLNDYSVGHALSRNIRAGVYHWRYATAEEIEAEAMRIEKEEKQ